MCCIFLCYSFFFVFLVGRVIDSLYPFNCAICLVMLFSLYFPSCVIENELSPFCSDCSYFVFMWVLCMVALVTVGFLKILCSNFDFPLFIVISRKCILLSSSDSILNFRFLLILLKSCGVFTIITVPLLDAWSYQLYSSNGFANVADT